MITRTRLRVCVESGCPTLTDQTRCPPCRAAREQQRGSRAARGYGAEHQAAKRVLRAEGHTHCAHCGKPFTSANLMQTGHVVAVRDGGTTADGVVPHCAACNQGWRRTGL